jgi:hypothetical protein
LTGVDFQGYLEKPFRKAEKECSGVRPGVKVKCLVIGYQFTEFGSIALTVYDWLIQAFQFDGFGTLGIEIVLFALLPLRLAAMFTVQSGGIAVMTEPVIGYRPAGYPVHYRFGIRLMAVIPFHISQGHYYSMEYVLFVLWLYLVGKSGSYPIIE